MLLRILISAFLLLVASCGASVPSDVVCDGEIHVVGDESALQSALGSAPTGSCIVLSEGTYSGPIAVGAGLSLTAADGDEVTITAGESYAALHITGEGAGLYHLRVGSGEQNGILVEAGSATIRNVNVFDLSGTAVAIRCEGDECMRTQIVLEEVEIRGSKNGLWISNVNVLLTNSVIAEQHSSSLSGGGGLYVVNGAKLEMTGTTVERNLLGMVVDGAATRVNLTDNVVSANEERGIWAQGLRGTLSDPSLDLGAGNLVEKNGVAGVGMFDTTGVVITGGRIVENVLAPVILPNFKTVEVGDGIGLYSGTGTVSVSGTDLQNNDRAQVVVDDGSNNIEFQGSNTVAGGKYNIVIQNTQATVVAPSGQVSQTNALPVPSEPIPIPQP